MKRITLLFAVITLFTASCKKDDTCPYSDSGLSASPAERTYLADYLAANSLAATEHTSGVFYSIVTAGSGASPSICSGLSVRYKGTLIPTGAQFDATPGTSTVSFQLGELIVGWQKVLPLIKRGGKIILYVPPSLAYGPQERRDPVTGAVVIPANSYLRFEIEIVEVQ